MEKYLQDFNTFVSEILNYHIRMNTDLNIAIIAEKIGVSDSFVQKVLYTPKVKHFNLKHIFLLSQELNMQPDKLLPSKENYKLLTNKELSDADWIKFRNNLKKEDTKNEWKLWRIKKTI